MQFYQLPHGRKIRTIIVGYREYHYMEKKLLLFDVFAEIKLFKYFIKVLCAFKGILFVD